MKKIILSDEQYKFIQRLAHLMEEQNNRATYYPLFVVQVKEKVYGSSDFCDNAEYIDEVGYDKLCEHHAKKLEEDGCLENEYCEYCDRDAFVWYKWEYKLDVNAGVFFTERTCENHIKANKHHYNEPRSYVISAWRNYELQTLMQMIFEMAGIDEPSQYS